MAKKGFKERNAKKEGRECLNPQFLPQARAGHDKLSLCMAAACI